MSVLTLVTAAALAATAPSLSAGQFLDQARPLLAKSKMALVMSGDARRLARQLGTTAQAHRARLDADRAAGRPVTTCLPPKGKAQIDANELIRHLEGLTPAQRADSFDSAFAGLMARKYPCKA